MHFEGQQVVSIATQLSMRNLVAASMATILIHYQGVDLKQAKVFELQIAGSCPDIYLGLAVIYFLISHSISWRGDLVSLGKWNSGDIDALSYASGFTKIESKTASLISRAEELLAGTLTNKDRSHLLSIKSELEDLNSKQKSYSSFFKIYFFGWYLLAPVFLSCWAMSLIL